MTPLLPPNPAASQPAMTGSNPDPYQKPDTHLQAVALRTPYAAAVLPADRWRSAARQVHKEYATAPRASAKLPRALSIPMLRDTFRSPFACVPQGTSSKRFSYALASVDHRDLKVALNRPRPNCIDAGQSLNRPLPYKRRKSIRESSQRNSAFQSGGRSAAHP